MVVAEDEVSLAAVVVVEEVVVAAFQAVRIIQAQEGKLDVVVLTVLLTSLFLRVLDETDSQSKR